MQGVANTAWAFATVNYRDEKLFAFWREQRSDDSECTHAARKNKIVGWISSSHLASLALARVVSDIHYE